jgi:tRNA modification GTPase
MENSTIAAIATPGGRGGIGIIKVSGLNALAIASTIFFPAEPQFSIDSARHRARRTLPADAIRSHRLYYGHIVDPDNGRVVDEVLLCAMKSPRSYTREDIVEINAHGGPAAVRTILDLVLKQGARLAEPGEFTRRAFLNGRIDLTQAEAVIDVINARTEKSLHLAAAQIRGTLRRSVEEIRESLVSILTRTEASIDFPDDVEELLEPEAVTAEINADVIGPLQDLIQKFTDGHVLRDGLKACVVGRPNVGKSSLLNCMVQKERAIVTELPGTTRDTIEEAITVDGVPIILFDTAGMHETTDPVEQIGISKTVENVNGADLVLFVIEADHPPTIDDHQIYEQFKHKPMLLVINKIDLVDPEVAEAVPTEWRFAKSVRISALYDRGIKLLKKEILATVIGDNPIEIESGIVPNLRQKCLLEDSLAAARAIRSEVNKEIAVELIAIHAQEAIDSLGQILGTDAKVDVLDQIFSRFCIGK